MEKEVTEMKERIGCDAASVWMRDEEDENLLYPYIFLGPNSKALEGKVLDIHSGLCGYCVRNAKELVSNDMTVEKEWYSQMDEMTKYSTYNIVCLPIIVYDECMGCIQLLNKEGGFNEDDLRECRKMVDFIIENL